MCRRRCSPRSSPRTKGRFARRRRRCSRCDDGGLESSASPSSPGPTTCGRAPWSRWSRRSSGKDATCESSIAASPWPDCGERIATISRRRSRTSHSCSARALRHCLRTPGCWWAATAPRSRPSVRGAALLRRVWPQQLAIKRPDICQAVETLGWAHRPNVNTTINTGERTVRVITDRDGLRVGLRGRVEGKRHVLLLGDSFMEALQVEYEQSVAGLLEARLTSRLGEPVAVRNGGVGGWDPPQYLMAPPRGT